MKTQLAPKGTLLIALQIMGLLAILYCLLYFFCATYAKAAESSPSINSQTLAAIQFAEMEVRIEDARPQMIKDVKDKVVQELASYIVMEKFGRAPKQWKMVARDRFPQSYQSVIVVGRKTITIEFFPKSDKSLGFINLMWYEFVPLRRPKSWIASVDLEGVTLGGINPGGDKNCSLYQNVGVENQVGTRHREFWQNECNQMIRIALGYFKDDTPLVLGKK